MKLLFCLECQDVRKLRIKQADDDFNDHCCKCGLSWGFYTDNINARYGGEAIPFGFANSEIALALSRWRIDKGNHTFTAFTIPDSADSITRKKE